MVQVRDTLPILLMKQNIVMVSWYLSVTGVVNLIWSFWQYQAQPITKISSTWRHFRFRNVFISVKLTWTNFVNNVLRVLSVLHCRRLTDWGLRSSNDDIDRVNIDGRGGGRGSIWNTIWWLTHSNNKFNFKCFISQKLQKIHKYCVCT